MGRAARRRSVTAVRSACPAGVKREEETPMQLGFVSAILPDLSFEQVVDFASATGYACLEVMCWPKGKAERRYAGITHIDCAALTASEAERLVNYAADRKVGISGLGYYPNALSPVADEAQVAVEQIHRVIDAAATMGV